MPKKIREIKQIISQAGFMQQKKRGKGSHGWWTHPDLPANPITIAGKDGDDAPRYLEQQVREALKALEEIQEEEEE